MVQQKGGGGGGNAANANATVREVDGAAKKLYAAMPPDSLLLVVTQAGLAPLVHLGEKKQRVQWEVSSMEQKNHVVGGGFHRSAWMQEDEMAYHSALHECANGYVFVASK
uniref:Uncharacterized protein n=1 Tax=Octactis speculum TaxID=3111310 RepID=A0A6U3WEH3_9STRA|mmetsp:Transcript_50459/g.68608  ORF Transcript_50459/g.68608 Transcript_50459/m.68608 type:complete len:110 (+) Transcript_50459:23-352(+)